MTADQRPEKKGHLLFFGVMIHDFSERGEAAMREVTRRREGSRRFNQAINKLARLNKTHSEK